VRVRVRERERERVKVRVRDGSVGIADDGQLRPYARGLPSSVVGHATRGQVGSKWRQG
jgi:hypothetical protein